MFINIADKVLLKVLYCLEWRLGPLSGKSFTDAANLLFVQQFICTENTEPCIAALYVMEQPGLWFYYIDDQKLIKF